MFAAIEQVPGLAASAAEWQGLLEGSYADAEPFLRDTGQLASACRCEHGCGCGHELVQTGPGRFRGVCTCGETGGCPDQEWTADQVRVLALNIPRFSREIARALECRPAFDRMSGTGIWQVGTWSAGAVPVLLLIAHTRAGLVSALVQLQLTLPASSILLALTARFLDAKMIELAARNGSRLYSLEALLRVGPGGRLQPLQRPGEVFARFTAQPVEPDPTGARTAFTLLRQLEETSPTKPPSVLTVFRLYCNEALSAAQIARRCQCSKTTVIDRIQRIREATGSDPQSFRALSGHFDHAEESVSDSRARDIYRQGLVEE